MTHPEFGNFKSLALAAGATPGARNPPKRMPASPATAQSPPRWIWACPITRVKHYAEEATHAPSCSELFVARSRQPANRSSWNLTWASVHAQSIMEKYYGRK